MLRPILPQYLDWPSLVGHVILSFGVLEKVLFDLLVDRTEGVERVRLAKESFQDRVLRLKEMVETDAALRAKVEGLDGFFERLESARVLRNHVAHGVLMHVPGEDSETLVQKLMLPKDASGVAYPEGRAWCFEEILSESAVLKDLVGEVAGLGGWVEGTWQVSLLGGGAER
jgi:hypothetical protein